MCGMCGVDEKITVFMQMENKINYCLDRANELNMFFNMFASKTSSASSSPAPRQTDYLAHLGARWILLLLHHCCPQPFMKRWASTPFPSLSWDLTGASLQVQMVSAPESRKPVWTSFVGFYSSSSPLTWARKMFLCSGWHPAFFQYQKISSICSYQL